MPRSRAWQHQSCFPRSRLRRRLRSLCSRCRSRLTPSVLCRLLLHQSLLHQSLQHRSLLHQSIQHRSLPYLLPSPCRHPLRRPALRRRTSSSPSLMLCQRSQCRQPRRRTASRRQRSRRQRNPRPRNPRPRNILLTSLPSPSGPSPSGPSRSRSPSTSPRSSPRRCFLPPQARTRSTRMSTVVVRLGPPTIGAFRRRWKTTTFPTKTPSAARWV